MMIYSLLGEKTLVYITEKIESLANASNKYNIVIDHQPKGLNECANNGVYLYLSGHTHAGQIFPLYYVYEILNINELKYGMKSIKQMRAVNTSGVSGWGFSIRTVHHSEYVIMNIKLMEIIYVFLTIFLYLLKCPQSLVL